ncbi:MAG: 5-formyltetrahydrofolate cyclo-ligase [Treponema sp.]|nr:5-formyltetrahydrofolate cyclo-ligase [Treponema sp.]
MEKMDKAAVRIMMKGAVEAMGEEKRSFASHKACVTLIKSELFLSADIILSYMATGAEADPFRISSAALSAFKMVAFPVCAKKGSSMDFFFVHGAGDKDTFLKQFTKNRYGILEPQAISSARVSLPPIRSKDILVIVPGLAFSPRGGRLGHGAGFYDRYLAELKEKAVEHDCNLNLVGMCFDCQISREMPVEKHDVPMDWLLSQSALVPCHHNVL